MKNREKYEKEILDVACVGERVAIDKRTMQIRGCGGFSCGRCLFGEADFCVEELGKWAESEYIERPKISKKDRAFLDYIDNRFKYIARDEDGTLLTFEAKPLKVVAQKRINPLLMGGWMYALNRNMSDFNISFPMVKWSDAEPWLIEDLKKLEVCNEY